MLDHDAAVARAQAEAEVKPTGGRVLLRYSGTEPKVRLLIEGRDQAVLDKWQVQTILALRASPLTETLQAQGGWRLVFTEREAVVFVRETDANRPLLARLARQSREAVPDDREETVARRSPPRAVDAVAVTWTPGRPATR